MSSLCAVFLGISFVSVALAFRFVSGPAAVVFQIIFGISFVLAALLLWKRRPGKKPVPSSFAASFKSDAPPATVPAAPGVVKS
jgi:hypothetical protein